MLNKKETKDLLKLIEKGGNDASLLLLDKIHTLQQDLTDLTAIIEKELLDETSLEKMANRLLTKITLPQDGHTPTKKELKELIKPLIPLPKQGKKGEKGDKGDKGEKGDIPTKKEITTLITSLFPEIPELDSPEQIRDKLESLEGKERLSIDAIHNLREALEDLLKQVKSKVHFYGGGGSGRDVVKSLNLNDYGPLDGSTKTFNLPAMKRLISVHSSSFPRAFIENTDYTWTPTSITFTSEINAATTLASGQTVIILYNQG